MNIVLDVLRYLNEHGITLVKAAEATGMAQQNIKKSIGNNPKASTLLALAKGLDVDPREFFYNLDEKETCDTRNTEMEEREVIKLPDDTNAVNAVNTTAFCPHCGARVKVGVVLLPE